MRATRHAVLLAPLCLLACVDSVHRRRWGVWSVRYFTDFLTVNMRDAEIVLGVSGGVSLDVCSIASHRVYLESLHI